MLNEKAGSLYEKEAIGRADGEEYSILTWFVSGMLFGFFVIPFIYFMKIKPSGLNYPSLTLDEEKSVYLKGYRATVQRKRLTGVILGWLTWLFAVAWYYGF